MTGTPLNPTPQVGGPALTQAWLEEARETGESDTYARQDREPRTTWGELLEIHVVRGSGGPRRQYATARDVASGGIGFVCREAIAPWTAILVCRAGEGVGAPAVVAHCARTVTGYAIGAQFRFEDQAQRHQAISLAG